MMRNIWLLSFILLALALPTPADGLANPAAKAPAAGSAALPAAAANPAADQWAAQTLGAMSLEEKVGQLFMIWAKVDFINPNGVEYLKLRNTMLKYHLGSFAVTSPMDGSLLLKASPLDAAALTNQLQRDSPLPLLFAADFERGLPMRFHGGTAFPHAMAIGATGNADYAYQFGRITAAEARAIGVHWNFYPDADINSNPNNPIINTRAFGEDPGEVSAMVQAFILGVHDGHGMATAKHFPGHGDTDTDSHLAVPRLNAGRQRLNQVELRPFRAAISQGVDAVMVGHLLVPALEPDPNRVATLSYNITTRLLQDEMGFQGIVITDAMDMNGLTRMFGGNTAQSAGHAAVEAIKAGSDMVLIPGDLDGAYNGVVAAVKSGELPLSRIDESATKILRAKAVLGLVRDRLVDLNAVSAALNFPTNVVLAQRIADQSVTLVRSSDNPQTGTQTNSPPLHPPTRPVNSRLLPLPRTAAASAQFAYHAAPAPANHLLLLVFTDDIRNENGRVLAREVRVRVPDARIFYIDETTALPLTPQVLEAAANAERIVAAVYAIPSAGRAVAGDGGSPGLDRGTATLLTALLKAAAENTVVVSLGNPYLIVQNPGIQTYVCTYSNATVSELSAVKFLFGEIPARGHLPVSIPGVAARVPMPQPEPAEH